MIKHILIRLGITIGIPLLLCIFAAIQVDTTELSWYIVFSLIPLAIYFIVCLIVLMYEVFLFYKQKKDDKIVINIFIIVFLLFLIVQILFMVDAFYL